MATSATALLPGHAALGHKCRGTRHVVSWPYSGPPETAWETGVNSGVQFYTEPCKTTPAARWTHAGLVIVEGMTQSGHRKSTEFN